MGVKEFTLHWCDNGKTRDLHIHVYYKQQRSVTMVSEDKILSIFNGKVLATNDKKLRTLITNLNEESVVSVVIEYVNNNKKSFGL